MLPLDAFGFLFTRWDYMRYHPPRTVYATLPYPGVSKNQLRPLGVKVGLSGVNINENWFFGGDGI